MSFEGFVIKSFLVLAGLAVVGGLSHQNDAPLRGQTVQSTPVRSTAEFSRAWDGLVDQAERGFGLTHAQAEKAAACVLAGELKDPDQSDDAQRAMAGACILGAERSQ